MRTVVLVDGEHYPPVLAAALARAGEMGYRVVAGVFLGGKEKVGEGGPELGIPLFRGETARALDEAIRVFRPEAVLDLSDDPVLDPPLRFRLASLALARGVRYLGPDFSFHPLPRPEVGNLPSIAVVATAKRSGKTAFSVELARSLKDMGRRPVVVAMGRGGPERPRVVRGDLTPPGVGDLLAVAEAGEHAASDYLEDAVLARVATVGTRRCGGGLAGTPFYDTVVEGVRMAAGLGDVLLLEGSGSALPPIRTGSTLLLVPAGTPPGLLGGYTGPARLLLADAVAFTMCQVSPGTPERLRRLERKVREYTSAPVLKTIFEPAPLEPLRGEKVFLAVTAPGAAAPEAVRRLEEAEGCRVVGTSSALADRERLARDLEKARGRYTVLLTELKAAAVDVAARAALEAGARVVFLHNRPRVLEGPSVQELAAMLLARAEGGEVAQR